MAYVAPTRADRVPVEILQEALRGRELGEIAFEMGWKRPIGRAKDTTGKPYGDGSRLKRTLGLRPSYWYKGKASCAATVDYKLAVQIIRAAGIDPVDVGI